MLVCGRQSIVEVNTSELIPAEDGPSVAVDFAIRIETYGFTAYRRVFIEQRDARTFVSHLRAIEQVRQAAVTLAAAPPEDFQLHIGFIGQTGRATASGRMIATDAGERAPALEFDFEFDPATLPTIVAECERWIVPIDQLWAVGIILPPGTNGATDVDWLLRVEENAPYTFMERVERHFEPWSGVRRRTADGLIRTQFKSTAVFQPFTDQTDRT